MTICRNLCHLITNCGSRLTACKWSDSKPERYGKLEIRFWKMASNEMTIRRDLCHLIRKLWFASDHLQVGVSSRAERCEQRKLGSRE